MQIARYSCYILMKFEFSQHFSKHAQISNIMKNPNSGRRVVPSIRTDGETSRS